MSTKPLVSVCVPVFNRPKEIKTCISSILQQTKKEFELLVLDDGSTDETPQVVEEFTDSRVKLVRHPKNRGNLSCRNDGFELSTGQFIAIMDSDDICHPQRLEQQVNALETGYDICGSWAANRVQNTFQLKPTWKVPEYRSQLAPRCLFGSPLPNPSVMMTREFLTSTDFKFDKKYFPAADYHAWAKAIILDDINITALQEPLISRYIHEASISDIHAERQWQAAGEVREFLIKNIGLDQSYSKALNHFARFSKFEHSTDKELLNEFCFSALPNACPALFDTTEAREFFAYKLKTKKTSVTPRSSNQSADIAKTELPQVSLIAAVYNTKKYLPQFFDSFRLQTGVKCELVLVNDGSTDGSRVLCKEFASLDSRVKVVSTRNQGLSSARNTGLHHAKGEYIMFVDSDDVLEPDSIAKLHKRITETNADVAVGAHYVFGEGIDDRQVRFQPDSETHYRENIIEHFGNRKFGYPAWNKLIRAPVARDISFHPSIFHEDELYCLQLFIRAKCVSTINDFTYGYRQRAGSITGTLTSKHIDDWAYITRKSLNLLQSRSVWSNTDTKGLAQVLLYFGRAGLKKMTVLHQSSNIDQFDHSSLFNEAISTAKRLNNMTDQHNNSANNRTVSYLSKFFNLLRRRLSKSH